MKRNRAFSLVELLVVIAIISTLAAMLFPSLQEAMKNAKRMSCLSDRRSLGQLTHAFANEHNDLTPHPIDSFSTGNRTMKQWRYGSWDAAWVVERASANVLAGHGTLTVTGYVPDPGLLFCNDFDNKNINISTSWNTSAFNAQWRELIDGDNDLGTYWSYSSVVDLMWCQDPKETWASTGIYRKNVTIDYLNRNWRSTYVGPILFGCLNNQGDCYLWWDGSGKSTALSHQGEGINAVFCDGSGRWISKEESGGTFGNSYTWGRSWDRTTCTISRR